MKLNKICLTAAAVSAALMSASALATDFQFNGYMRSGFGMNADGGSQRCYGTGGPNWHTVGRLGDECDTYAELSLSANNVFQQDDEAFSVHTLVAYGTPEGTADGRGNSFQQIGTDAEDPWTGQRAAFREAWVDYKMDNNMTLWAGNRYYGRKDIHILDFYYINNSGNGIGVENIEVGPGKVSAAVVQHKWKAPLVDTETGEALEDTQIYSTANTVDLRYSGLNTNENGSMEFVLLAAKPSYTSKQDKAIDNGVGNAADYGLDEFGYSLTAEHTQGDFFGGFNKLALQYSTEGYAWSGFIGNHLGDSYNMETAQKGRKALRLIDWGVISGEKWDLGYSAIYAQLDKGDAGGDDAKWYNLVLRPSYKWSETMSTVVEAGYYSQDFGSSWGAGDWTDLSKITVAQQWQAGSSFWARPAIRVFASMYDGDQAVKDNDMMFGVSAEAWW